MLTPGQRTAERGLTFALVLLLVGCVVGTANATTRWRTETTDPLALRGDACGSLASDLTQVPPFGVIGSVFGLRLLNLRVGQKLTDSTTGQITATVTKVELLRVSRGGADLRVRVIGSDAACEDPRLAQTGWVADPRVRVRFVEVIPSRCGDLPRAEVYGLAAYVVRCRFGRQLAVAWTHRCHDRTCWVDRYHCIRRRDKLVDCVRGRREVSWALPPVPTAYLSATGAFGLPPAGLAAASLTSARLICNRPNEPGSPGTPRITPTACVILKDSDSFAEGLRLARLNWHHWGAATATATGRSLGFHFPFPSRSVTVRAYRVRPDPCGAYERLYTRVRIAWSRDSIGPSGSHVYRPLTGCL